MVGVESSLLPIIFFIYIVVVDVSVSVMTLTGHSPRCYGR